MLDEGLVNSNVKNTAVYAFDDEGLVRMLIIIIIPGP